MEERKMNDYTLQTVITRLKKEKEALIKKNKVLSKQNTKYKDLIIKMNGQTMRVLNDD